MAHAQQPPGAEHRGEIGVHTTIDCCLRRLGSLLEAGACLCLDILADVTAGANCEQERYQEYPVYRCPAAQVTSEAGEPRPQRCPASAKSTDTERHLPSKRPAR